MSTYRETTLKAKAVRAGIVEQRPVGGRNAKPRPVIAEHRMAPRSGMRLGPKDWVKWRAYRNEAEAQVAIDAAARKYSFYEFRIKP